MKAHINGITIEGTPQEIMEYQRLQAEQAKMKPLAPFKPWYGPQKNPYGSGSALFPPDVKIICMNMMEE